MVSIGIDLVEIERFAHWHTKSQEQLLRLFSRDEINYCLSVPAKSAERFAARFAVKEAFYKALCTLLEHKKSFLFVCKQTSFVKKITINWPQLDLPEYNITASLTHTRTTAGAVVIITQ